MVIGSNLGRTKVNFLFAKILFLAWKGKIIETLAVRAARRTAKMIMKQPLNDH